MFEPVTICSGFEFATIRCEFTPAHGVRLTKKLPLVTKPKNPGHKTEESRSQNRRIPVSCNGFVSEEIFRTYEDDYLHVEFTRTDSHHSRSTAKCYISNHIPCRYFNTFINWKTICLHIIQGIGNYTSPCFFQLAVQCRFLHVHLYA